MGEFIFSFNSAVIVGSMFNVFSGSLVSFKVGIIPESWLVGTIKPFYKNKGNKHYPKNFRPITILSCLGKLFTAILNNRLKTYSESFLLLNRLISNIGPGGALRPLSTEIKL
jgi:hypothetical protein